MLKGFVSRSYPTPTNPLDLDGCSALFCYCFGCVHSLRRQTAQREIDKAIMVILYTIQDRDAQNHGIGPVVSVVFISNFGHFSLVGPM